MYYLHVWFPFCGFWIKKNTSPNRLYFLHFTLPNSGDSLACMGAAPWCAHPPLEGAERPAQHGTESTHFSEEGQGARWLVPARKLLLVLLASCSPSWSDQLIQQLYVSVLNLLVLVHFICLTLILRWPSSKRKCPSLRWPILAGCIPSPRTWQTPTVRRAIFWKLTFMIHKLWESGAPVTQHTKFAWG